MNHLKIIINGRNKVGQIKPFMTHLEKGCRKETAFEAKAQVRSVNIPEV